MATKEKAAYDEALASARGAYHGLYGIKNVVRAMASGPNDFPSCTPAQYACAMHVHHLRVLDDLELKRRALTTFPARPRL